MKKIKVLIVVISLILFSACYKNPIERNTIVFNDNIQNVQDSILKIQELLSIFPKNTDGLNTNYYFDNNDIYINNLLIGNQDLIVMDTVKVFSNYNKLYKKEFLILSKYLNRNHLKGAYIDKSLNIWVFTYRYLANGDFHDTREIVVISDKKSNVIKSQCKILDLKKMIFLISPIDAKIR